MLVDPIVKKDGAGTDIPIHITGTREEQKMEFAVGGITVGKTLRKKK